MGSPTMCYRDLLIDYLEIFDKNYQEPELCELSNNELENIITKINSNNSNFIAFNAGRNFENYLNEADIDSFNACAGCYKKYVNLFCNDSPFK